MTRVLLVEDDDSSIQAVCDILEGLPGRVVPTVAKTRDDAIRLLKVELFDLMILDLTIPATETTEKGQPEFGFAVFGSAKEIAPGMPIFVLTGSSVESFVPEMLRNAQNVDVWSSGKVNTVSLLKKIKLAEFPSALTPYIDGPHQLDDVELERNGVTLSIMEERLLRIFAKRFHGVRCIVKELNGGLSGARVLRVALQNAQGRYINHAVGKIGALADIQNEKMLYEQHIVNLPPQATPRLLTALEFGAKATAAIFYGLADGHDSSFFQFLERHAGLCDVAVQRTADGLAPWREAAEQSVRLVREFRRRLLSDEERTEVLRRVPIAWADEFENRKVPTKWGCIHGDCHGGNVLLTADGTPAVIDYGDIGVGPLSLDPIALELSLFFHPSGPLVASDWPDAATAAAWGNLDQYLVGCPYPAYIRACRKWATDMAVGYREMAASVYSYLLRQLKYEGTNKQRVLDLLEGARQLFDST